LHRFTAPGSFGPVLRSARKLRGDHVVLHIAASAQSASRLGIALPRRLVASSVQRNRIKRVVREIFRRHPAKHGALDMVITLRNRWDGAAATAFQQEVRRLMDRACATAP